MGHGGFVVVLVFCDLNLYMYNKVLTSTIDVLLAFPAPFASSASFHLLG